MPSLYTPFLAQAGANIGNAMASRGQRERLEAQNKLAGEAYLGNPQALQELATLNPPLYAKILEETRKRKESQQQQSLNKRTQFKKELDDYRRNLAKYATYEKSETYGQRMTEYFQKTYPDQIDERGLDAKYDIDDWNQAQVFGQDDKDGQSKSIIDVKQPIRLINKKTDEEMLVSPQVNKETGFTHLNPFDIPEGFEIAKETDVEKRIADTLAANTRKIESLKAEQELKPGIREAVDTAAAKVKFETQQKANLVTYTAFKVGMGNVTESLNNTLTGFLAGRLPAATAKQQIADGAKSIMLPLLKSLFRTAGEGIFTDKDQELLEGMLPTRIDHPEAAQAKISMVNTIVALKLGLPIPEEELTPDELTELEQLRKEQQ